jgi:hypothetical protein
VPNPYAGLLPGTSLNGATMSLQQSLLPYSQFTGVTETGMPIGTAKYQSLVVQVEKRLSQNFSVLLTGTFGKSSTYSTYLNNGMDAPGQFITRDGGTPPHEINISGVYKAPFFRNSANPLVKMALAGWQLSGYTQWVSGALLNVTGAYPTGINPAFSDPSVHGSWFNTCTYNQTNNTTQNCAAGEPVAWTIQKPFTLNTVPPPQWSNFRGRAIPETSLAIVKSFRITERVAFQLHADADNVLNTPTFAAPNVSATSSLFGTTALIEGFNYSSVGGPRQIQLGGKLSF